MPASRNMQLYEEMQAQAAPHGVGELPPADALSKLPDSPLSSLIKDIFAYQEDAARPDHAEGWPAFIKNG